MFSVNEMESFICRLGFMPIVNQIETNFLIIVTNCILIEYFGTMTFLLSLKLIFQFAFH